MNTTLLPLAVKNIGMNLESMLPRLAAGKPTRHGTHQLCHMYRLIAYGEFLMSCDLKPWVEHLSKSAHARHAFLTTAPSEQKACSQTDAFFDAVACQDHDTAHALATAAPRQCADHLEYEEDYCYLRFLMDTFLGEPDAARETLLNRWSVLLDGAADARFALCLTLWEKDSDALPDVLADAIEAVLEEKAKTAASGRLSVDETTILAHLSTEVLTWLHLCAPHIALEADYPLAPAPLRSPHRLPFPDPDAWRTLNRTFLTVTQ